MSHESEERAIEVSSEGAKGPKQLHGKYVGRKSRLHPLGLPATRSCARTARGNRGLRWPRFTCRRLGCAAVARRLGAEARALRWTGLPHQQDLARAGSSEVLSHRHRKGRGCGRNPDRGSVAKLGRERSTHARIARYAWDHAAQSDMRSKALPGEARAPNAQETMAKLRFLIGFTTDPI